MPNTTQQTTQPIPSQAAPQQPNIPGAQPIMPNQPNTTADQQQSQTEPQSKSQTTEQPQQPSQAETQQSPEASQTPEQQKSPSELLNEELDRRLSKIENVEIAQRTIRETVCEYAANIFLLAKNNETIKQKLQSPQEICKGFADKNREALALKVFTELNNLFTDKPDFVNFSDPQNPNEPVSQEAERQTIAALGLIMLNGHLDGKSLATVLPGGIRLNRTATQSQTGQNGETTHQVAFYHSDTRSMELNISLFNRNNSSEKPITDERQYAPKQAIWHELGHALEGYIYSPALLQQNPELQKNQAAIQAQEQKLAENLFIFRAENRDGREVLVNKLFETPYIYSLLQEYKTDPNKTTKESIISEKRAEDARIFAHITKENNGEPVSKAKMFGEYLKYRILYSAALHLKEVHTLSDTENSQDILIQAKQIELLLSSMGKVNTIEEAKNWFIARIGTEPNKPIKLSQDAVNNLSDLIAEAECVVERHYAFANIADKVNYINQVGSVAGRDSSTPGSVADDDFYDYNFGSSANVDSGSETQKGPGFFAKAWRYFTWLINPNDTSKTPPQVQ